MAEPILELAARAVATQVKTITVANGYATTVESVIRPTRRLDPDDSEYERYFVHNRVVLTQGERFRPENGGDMLSAWAQPFELSLVLRPGKTSTTPMETLVNRFVADVDKAFRLGNAPSWYPAGVYDHEVRGPLPLPDELSEADGVRMIIDVYYRTRVDDPTVAA